MAAICPKMLPVAAVFVGLHICHRVSSLPKPHRVGYVTTSTLLLASSPATCPGYCRSMRAGNNLVSLRIFFLHFSRNGVLLFRNKLRETITCRPILSGGCELSHGFAVIDLSLEQSERAQGFLDTVCTEIARPICL